MDESVSPINASSKRLEEDIKATWSSRLTAALGSLFLIFGRKSDPSLDKHQTSSILLSQEQKAAINDPSLKTISAAKTLDELLAYDGESYITCAYLTLLGRNPDPQGFFYYLDRLRKTNDKLTIVYDLYQSREAQQFNNKVVGLKTALRRLRLQRFIDGRLIRGPKDNLQEQIVGALYELNGRIDALEVTITHGLKEIEQSAALFFRPFVDKQVNLMFANFDGNKYLKAHSDVAAAGMNPYEHWIRAGFSERRWPPQEPTRPQPVSNPKPDDILPVPENEPLVYSDPPLTPKVKLIALYLPQFHPIPENDKWWGKGFTEWTNVTRAKPFYVGHEQPKLPGELGFYDLRLVEIMRRQAKLARIHGIFGFCFYVYWFAGHRLLETPINIFLNNPDIEINFCYCWANENWTRRWDGLEKDVLIEQSHSPEDDIAFIKSIAVGFKDKRYIKVENKPLLILYRPGLLPDCKQTVKRWRKWCRENGVGEIYVAFTESFDGSDPREFGMDASIQFPPLTNGPHKEITAECRMLDGTFKGKIYDYADLVRNTSHYIRPGWTQYRTVMPSWDNTARKMEYGFSFKGATSELYGKWLSDVSVETVKHFGSHGGLIFVNAWNEWAEGAYLEPDKLRGYAFLNRTREVISKFAMPVTIENELVRVKERGNDVAVVIHLFHLDLLNVVFKYLDNICKRADIYFSVRDGTHKIVSEKIKARYSHAVVVSYPNHGRDVLPFLKILRHSQRLKYRAVCKIHTKKSKHRADGDIWRDDVLNKLLGSDKIIDSCLSKINSGAGVIAPAGHLLDSSNYWGSNAEKVTRLAKRMGCPQAWIDHFFFPAGTMFWVAPEALQPLLSLGLQDDDFEAEDGQVDGTTAHAVERVISLSARMAGLSIVETSGEASWNGESYPFAAKG